MGILTRYILRAHLGPLLFAFTALTGLLFLNAVAQRAEALMGKGLGWEIILEFVILSLPHTVALTLPMSVLVAVLYTFSDLTARNEITAMTAGGVRPSRILLPVILAGATFAVGMLYFNDQILPEANHGLKNLMVDVGNKSPTFELEEQVVNEVRTVDGSSRFYLQASRIDRETNDLYDVVIHDVSVGTGHRTTYADSGSMAFTPDGTDLYMTLYDGFVFEADELDPGAFQRVRFDRQVVPLRGVGDILERRTGGGQRSEREMTIRMLEATVRERQARRRQIEEEVQAASVDAVRQALGIGPGPRELPDDVTEVTGSATIESGASSGPGASDAPADVSAASSAPGAESAAVRLLAHQASPGEADVLTRTTAANVRTRALQAESLERSTAALRVEIHKKYAIAFACLVFVLVGAPIAVRFPRGGVGMTIAVSVGIFGIYWVGLIGGEKLAEEGVVHPFVSMWATNLVFLVVGIFMSLRLGRWVATSRGGGWDDLRQSLSKMFSRPMKLVRDEA